MLCLTFIVFYFFLCPISWAGLIFYAKKRAKVLHFSQSTKFFNKKKHFGGR